MANTNTEISMELKSQHLQKKLRELKDEQDRLTKLNLEISKAVKASEIVIKLFSPYEFR
jgi:hypothetical protein